MKGVLSSGSAALSGDHVEDDSNLLGMVKLHR